ncbi:MAG: phosphohistidine phosphatase SixA [Planctomycetia bacterium]|nr:phosphohistidine phosphatase SixA [Planctomycetia bacterium]
MRLYIIRHAWAEEPGDARWPNDADRPLTESGKKRFKKVVEILATRGFAPELIVTSPYVRTRQTTEILHDHLSKKPALVESAALAPGSRLADLVEWTNERKESEIAWVGHMPDVALMTAALIGDRHTLIDFGKGAVAAIDFDAAPAAGNGTLRWFVSPKLLGC